MSDNNILRVGTDCSGIEAPIQALLQLNIPFKHIFSSEIDKYCIKSIKANYDPEIIFGDKEGPFPEGDITKRNIDDVPDIDLYVCGFPCQTFSMAGKRKGLNDKRGIVFWSCLEVIETKQPKYFILENVRGLLSHDKGNTWNIIWKAVKELEKYNYNIKWKILNTREYGIPQNRERIFIVGVKCKDFEWPEKKKMNDIKNYVDWNDIGNSKPIPNYILSLINKPNKYGIIINAGFRDCKYVNSHLYSPCINRTDCQKLWLIPLNRFVTVKELLKLQGFNNFKQVVSNTQIKFQIGNSMSVNVLCEIFKSILK